MSTENASGVAEQTPRPARGASQYRELGTIVAVIVVAAAGVLLMTSLRWLQLDASRPPPFAAVHTAVKGRQEFPALAGLGIVALLVAVLALVTGLWARRALGVLLLGVGLWCGGYGLRGLSAPGAARQITLLDGPGTSKYGFVHASVELAPAVLTVVLSVALVLAGAALAVRARRWSGGLSARYAAPAEARKVEDPWRRLDRGEDPTDSDR